MREKKGNRNRKKKGNETTAEREEIGGKNGGHPPGEEKKDTMRVPYFFFMKTITPENRQKKSRFTVRGGGGVLERRGESHKFRRGEKPPKFKGETFHTRLRERLHTLIYSPEEKGAYRTKGTVRRYVSQREGGGVTWQGGCPEKGALFMDQQNKA